MSLINDFIRSLPDNGVALYNLVDPISRGLAASLVLGYLWRMKTNLLTTLKGIAFGFIALYFAAYAQFFMVWYRVGFDPNRYFQTANIALGFTLLPLLAWLCAKTFNTSNGFAGDVVTLTLLGFHVTGRSGCTFTGCCYGFPCDWGIYSHQTKANQFPVMWVESLFTLAILIFIIVRICRKGYVPDGKNLPYFLLLYGACRFFSEMTRESTKENWLFWRISDIHIHMVVMAAVGGFLLWRIAQRERAAAVGEEPALSTLKGQRK